MASENGWEPLHPNADQLEWVAVPGTNVHLQFLKGWPSIILRAFAADFNAYIEPLRDADSAGYTATNSVATSNHLNGTAMDLNWNSHPFQILNAGFDAAKIATARELLDFYEDTVWWGNDWNSPKDAMHWNMSYDTYNNPHVGDVIARKIRADGFSTFRRANNPAPPPVVVPPTLSRADGYALRIINEGRKRGVTPKGIQIALATGIVESNITVYANSKLPKSLALPHDAVGSDGLSVGIFQQQVKDTGNGWWWGDEVTCMGVESSADLFYDRLVNLPYNGDSKTPGGFAQQIQGSAFPDRYDQHWGEAVALYNRLANTTTDPGEDDDMIPPNEWNAVRDIVLAQVTSQSPFRRPGETTTVHWLQMLRAMDGNTHGPRTIILAAHGYPPAIEDLRLVADCDPSRYPDRSSDKDLASAILSDLADDTRRLALIDAALTSLASGAPFALPTASAAPVANPALTTAFAQDVADRTAAAINQLQPAPVPAVIEPPSTGGSLGVRVGKFIDSVGELDLAGSADINERATLAASIKVLATKNGSDL